MVTREQVELLTLLWTIFIAIVGFLSKKIHSYITESVSERECYNTDEALFLVLGIMALQVLYNLKTKVVREIEYRVKVKGRSTPYKFQTKPRKTGNFFSARMLDEEHKETKRMLLPESEIEKIEYIIKEKRG